MNNNAFIALYAWHTPYAQYSDIPRELQQLTVPVVLMQLRWDGSFGFVGGLIDTGENSMNAILREAEEEIGWCVSETQFDRITYHADCSSQLHSEFYSIELSYPALKTIHSTSSSAEHFLGESLGTVLVPLHPFTSKTVLNTQPGLELFLKNQFAKNAKEQLMFLQNHLIASK